MLGRLLITKCINSISTKLNSPGQTIGTLGDVMGRVFHENVNAVRQVCAP
jgi:hypothetical protein